MRNSISTLFVGAALLLQGVLLTACLSDNDDSVVEVSNECVLTAVRLNNLQRTLHTRTTDGKRDSSYTVTVTGGYYPFTIDQQQGRVYNVDSLPAGTQLKRVVFSTINAKGIVALQSLTTGKDSLFSTTDSIDASVARRLIVRAADGATQRSYTLEVRCHQEEGDSARWSAMKTADWDEKQFQQPAAGTWRSSTMQFKLEGSELLCSTDGSTWRAETIDADDAQFLPTENICGASQLTRVHPRLEQVLLYGTKNGVAHVWQRNIDLDGRQAFGWMFLPASSENTYPAPALQQAHLFAFDDGFLLIGLDAAQRVSMRYTIDRGRTWKEHPHFRLPQVRSSVARLRAAIDSDGSLWLRINNDLIWRGQINRLAWKPVQNVFNAQHR